MNQDVDWLKIKTEYITNPKASYRNLSEKYGVSRTNLERRAKKEGWVERRRQTSGKMVARAVSEYEKKQAKKMVDIDRIANKLLRKIEQAVDEIDMQIVTMVEKTKTVEYKDSRSPGKPTKETINEKTILSEVHTLIDRQGLRVLASALRDLKDAKGILSPIEVREKEAQIDAINIRTAASKVNEGDEDGGGGVIMLAEVDEPPREVDNGE